MTKLKLHRETLLRLTEAEQDAIQAGLMPESNSNGLCPISNNTKCPTESPRCKLRTF